MGNDLCQFVIVWYLSLCLVSFSYIIKPNISILDCGKFVKYI